MKILKSFPIILMIGMIFLLLIVSYMFINKDQSDEEALYPKQGILDLTTWENTRIRPSLIGEWEFYWDQLLSYDDFQQDKQDNKQLVYVPNTWDAYEGDQDKLPGFGFATYRIKIINHKSREKLSLRIDTMSTSYKLFINNEEIASNGEVGKDGKSSKPQYQPQVVDFFPPAEEFDLIVQVSNFTYARGGIWYEINLGTPEQIDEINRIIVYKDALLIGSLLIMALYFGSFHFVLRKDKSSKYFMLLCTIFIIRTSIYGDSLLIRIFPNISFELLIFLTYATLYWITIVIYLLVDSLYESHFRIRYDKIFIIYGIIATIFTGFLPIHLYTQWITGIEIFGTFMVVLALFIVVKAFVHKKSGSGLILLAVAIILGTGIHDVLYQANVIHNKVGELASIGIFLFMFTFSFSIARRLSDALEAARTLSIELNEALRKEKVAAKELMTSEMAFLKAQIKPHFIYNSLSVIAALILDEPHRAKELLYHLTDYLRGSFHFDHDRGLAPLDEELATVKAYIEIEKARFIGRLEVDFILQEGIHCLVPLLTIQPLVENAVRHGILKKTEGGRVQVLIYDENEVVHIEVVDDGVGIEKTKLKQILEEETSIQGVGIKNINRRLVLFYGNGLDIQSEEGIGTRVIIRIPKKGVGV